MNADKEKLYKEIIKLYDEYRWTTSTQKYQHILKDILEMKEMLALYDKDKSNERRKGETLPGNHRAHV